MTIEERLTRAFQHVDAVDPSPDLWARVVHSIDEERRHRQRVVTTTGAIVAALVAVVAIAGSALRENRYGRFVDRPTLEALEIAVLSIVVLALGPAIRRFGRGFAADLWPAGSVTPTALLRLLDVAYFLVFSGYILLTTEFNFGPAFRRETLGEQLGESAQRIGGLLLIVGLLHALTIAALPLVAMIDNSTRAHRPLPRSTIAIAVLVGVTVVPVFLILIGGLIGG
jgi:uncharacterized membrane protein YidH (DUF202 family)